MLISFLFQQCDAPPTDDVACILPEADLLTLLIPDNRNNNPSPDAPSPSLDLNDNEDLPTELSDSSETHDEGMWLTTLNQDTCHNILDLIWPFSHFKQGPSL